MNFKTYYDIHGKYTYVFDDGSKLIFKNKPRSELFKVLVNDKTLYASTVMTIYFGCCYIVEPNMFFGKLCIGSYVIAATIVIADAMFPDTDKMAMNINIKRQNIINKGARSIKLADLDYLTEKEALDKFGEYDDELNSLQDIRKYIVNA